MQPSTRTPGHAQNAHDSGPTASSAAGAASGPQLPVPVPLTRNRSLPPFPTEALPAPVSTMVQAVALFTQTDAGMAGTTAIGMLAAAVGGRVEIEVTPGWREPLNLYTAIFAGPGERKSAVQDLMSAPVHAAEAELVTTAKAARLEATLTRDVATDAAEKAKKAAARATGANKGQLLADAIGAMQAAESVVVPPLPRLVADDVTPERCAGLLAEQQGRLAIVSAEGGIFDVIGGRYSHGIPSLDVWLKGHSGDRLRIDRQTREPEFIEHPALTLSLMVQPTLLTNLARNHDFRGRGLLARFLFALPPSKVGHRLVGTDPIPDEIRAEYNGRVKALALSFAGWGSDPAVLQLTPEAVRLNTAIGQAIEPKLAGTGDLGHIADWGSKLNGAILRIAGLLHVAQHSTDAWRRPVEASTLDQAAVLGSYYTAHALAAFDAMRLDPAVADAEYLLDRMRQLQQPRVSTRDLQAASSRSRFMRVHDLDTPLRLLEEHGYIRRLPQEPQVARGRPPSPSWAVHPSVFAEATA